MKKKNKPQQNNPTKKHQVIQKTELYKASVETAEFTG